MKRIDKPPQSLKERICRVALLSLALFPAFKPSFFEQAFGAWVANLFSVAVFIVILALSILFITQRHKIDSFFVLFIVLMAVLLLSTVLNHGEKSRWVTWFLPCILAVQIVCLFSDNRCRELAIAIFVVTFSLSLLDFISMVLYPGGILKGDTYFLGNRDGAFQSFLPAMLSSLLLYKAGNRLFGAFFLLSTLVGFGQLWLGGSATGTLAFLCLLVALAAGHFARMRPHLSFATFCGISIAAFLAIVVARIHVIAEPFITGVLHRSITLTGRTGIWDTVFGLFDFQHALLGWGMSAHKLLVVNGAHYWYAHNLYLELWLDGGLIAVLLFGCLLFLVSRRRWATRRDSVAAILSAFAGTYLLIGITESMLCPSFFLVLALCYYWTLPQTNDGQATMREGSSGHSSEANGHPAIAPET